MEKLDQNIEDIMRQGVRVPKGKSRPRTNGKPGSMNCSGNATEVPQPEAAEHQPLAALWPPPSEGIMKTTALHRAVVLASRLGYCSQSVHI